MTLSGVERRNSVDVEDQSEKDDSQPCCTWKSCCGSTMSYRDLMLIAGEVPSGLGLIGSGATAGLSADSTVRAVASTVTALFAAVFLVLVISHICWRRDAVLVNFTKTTDKLGETGTELENTAAKTAEAVNLLTEENTSLKERIAALEGLPNQFEEQNKELTTQVGKLKERAKKLRGRLVEMKTNNQTLTDQLDRCREAINAITAHVGKVNEVNATIASDLTVLDTNLAKLGEQNETFKGTVVAVDGKIDEDIAQLKQVLLDSQNIVGTTVKSFAEQVQTLQKDLETLQKLEKSVDLDEDTVRDRMNDLKALNEQIAEKEKALALLEQKLQNAHEALSALDSALAEKVKTLGETESRFSNDNLELKKLVENVREHTQPLTELVASLSKNRKSLDDMEEKLKRQEDEINELE